MHHLAHQLGDPRNCVVLTGYQAVGTRGRDLLEGAREVKMHGRYVPVRAEVVDDPEFSVHADSDEIIEWLSRIETPPTTLYAVHGEPAASRALADRIARELLDSGGPARRRARSLAGLDDGWTARNRGDHPDVVQSAWSVPQQQDRQAGVMVLVSMTAR